MRQQEQHPQWYPHNEVRIDASAASTTDHPSFNPHPVSKATAITTDFLSLSKALANIPQMQDLSRAFFCSSVSAAPRRLPASQGLLRAMQIGQTAFTPYHNGNDTISVASPAAKHSRSRHIDDDSMKEVMSGPLLTYTISRTPRAATRGIAVPVDALTKNDGVRGRKDEESNAGTVLKEEIRTYEPSHRHHARALPNKRRVPLTDLSKLTAEEQERWKKARARKYSASARQRRLDREQNLKDQVEISSVFRVLVEAAPDAVLLLSPDERARILFANDQCGHLLRLDSLIPKGQALVGQSLWEWMDGKDKASVVAAIGVCLYCKGATRRVQCTLYSPRSPFVPQPQVAQQQGHQEP